jgi:hypothetical protein
MGPLAPNEIHWIIQVTLAFSLSGTAILRAWITYRKFTVHEHSRTERLSAAISGSQPEQRPDIIRACSELENGADPRRRPRKKKWRADGREAPQSPKSQQSTV